MKNGIIFARKSTWRSRLDLEYLDETSRRKISGREAHSANLETVRKLRQFGDYASKETLGQVHAGGFLHDLIRVNADGASVAPSKLTNDERKKRISESWCRHLRKFPTSSENPVIQHRLVFSMSGELHDNLVASASPQKLEEHLSRRFDSDKINFAPRLNHSQMNALRSTQTADAIRLQQLYRAIRDLEASITAKRHYLASKRNAQLVSRLLGRRTQKVTRVVEKLAAAVDRRSLREMQNLLFKIKQQCRAAHKRYAQIHGFSSYANRSTVPLAHRQQNAL